jgi:outer membrane receptor protein involved in Fe transport
MRAIRVPLAALLVCTCVRALAEPAPAPHEPDEEAAVLVDEVIEVVDSLPREAAAEERITAEELRLRPRRTPGQLLESAPGLVVGQHAGGGKADQIFMRGFDADHGTDVAISVDGVPVNVVSHAHGQGYADLHFVIPEMVDHVHVYKGPYAVDGGDFMTAGAVRLQTMRHLEEPFVSAAGGSFSTMRLVGAAGGSRGVLDGWMAGEIFHSNGPFDEAQRLRRYNLMGKMTASLGELSDLWFEVTSYGGGWNASGQIPLREVEAGRLSRFGSIDPSEGGLSARESMAIGWISHPHEGRDDLILRAYAVRYRLDLFSNFTFFLDDPTMGDGIEQVDSRTTVGAQAEHKTRRQLLGRDFSFRLGVDSRSDRADVALYHQRERERLEVKNRAHVAQSSLATYAEAALGCQDAWHLGVGGRVDFFDWQVDEAEGTAESGIAKRMIANPKLRGDVRLAQAGHVAVELIGNAGGGFHSNDARNVVATGEDTLPRALGADAGVRVRHLEGAFEATLGGWFLRLEREFVWVGDAGEVDVRGATRRLGGELTGRARITSWLGAEGEATLTRARFEDEPAGMDRVPLAPELTLVGNLIARHPSGLAGALRVRHLADRPAEETGRVTAEGFTVLDATAHYRRGAFELEVAVDNLLDTDYREAQFFFESRLADEPAPVEDLHFTPGVPRSARASLTMFW